MNFFSFLIQKRFPNKKTREQIAAGPFTASKLLLIALIAVFFVIIYIIIIKANDKLLVTVPARGGSLAEGVVGAPRAIDPLAAVTETDVALTRLVYAGLMKQNGDGTIVPELASEYSVSPDDRTYTFMLRDKLEFSDGSPLTAADVSATIEAMQDPAADPRSFAYWQNVTISTPNESTVVATIPAPDDTFLEHMTVGIMQASALKGTETQQESETAVTEKIDLSPVGAGAFKLRSVMYNESGSPKKLHFVRNHRYPLGSPLLSSLDVIVYANQDALLSALENGGIDLTFGLAPETLAPEKLQGVAAFEAIPTDKTVGLWQLQSSELSSESFRATINRFIDKSTLIAIIENGYGISPAGTDSVPLSSEEAQLALKKSGYAFSNGTLSRGGIPVSLSIATLNDPKLLSTARALTDSLTALGAVTQVLSFDPGTLRNDVAESKLPLILNDGTIPLPSTYSEAIPLYTSAIVLGSNADAHGIATPELLSPTLRYANVSQWHTNTDRVWKFLVRNR